MRIKEILVNFRMEDMFDADKRVQFNEAVNSLWEVVVAAGDTATPMDRMIAAYGVDKYEEYNANIFDRYSA